MLLDNKSKYFVKFSFTQRKSVRPFGLSVLIAGLDKKGEPCVYSSEPSGFSSQWKAIAVGKNAEKVNEYLENKFQDNLEYKEALLLMLESMLEYVESGSKNIEVAYMKRGEPMRYVSDEEIDNLSAFIEEEKKKKEKK